MDDFDHPSPPDPKNTIFDAQDLVGSIAGVVVSGILILIFWKIVGTKQMGAGYYGTGVFMVVPILSGFIAGSVSNWSEKRPTATIWLSSLLQLFFAGAGLLSFGIEGGVCILMASPLLYPMFAVGCFLGQIAMNLRRGDKGLMVSVVPVLVVMGLSANSLDPIFATKTESTTVIVNAPPEKIWPFLFHLQDLPKPDQLIFKTGIAYTIGTHAEGQSVGSSRLCQLTTGTMKETISAMETNRYMRFKVLNTPASIKESNPFYDVHPRHETDSFRVNWGEFKLEPLSGGRTRFTGTSNYSYNIFPAWYWGLYTDTVAEQIHVRMMGEIKRRAESTR
jgi:hypothetical protein